MPAAAAAAGPNGYRFGRVLGEGAFAHVIHARSKEDNHDVAIKVMLKSHIEREGKERAVMAEQRALRECSECSHVVHLERTFQDDEHLFFVLEFAAGGDLLRAMHRLSRPEGGMTPADSAFYAAEVWLGLQFLHERGLAHRDVKPENVLLDERGRAKLADFGAVLDTRGREDKDCVRASENRPLKLTGGQLSERHGSFEGTAEYVSPEVLQGESTTTACDLWALGCLVYQLTTGRLPFRAATDFLLWEKIIAFAQGEGSLDVPSSLSPEAEDLVRALLRKDARDRLGAKHPEDLEKHPFFRQVDWEKQGQGLVDPPTPPVLSRAVYSDDSKFSDFSIEFMLELDMRDDDSEDDSCTISTAGFGEEDDFVNRRRRRQSAPAAPVGSSAGGGIVFAKPSSAGKRQSFWGSGAQSMRSLGTPPPSPPRARSPPPRLQPSTVPTSATRAAVESFDWPSLLAPDEKILWTGIIWKRKGLLWRERVFVLTALPRFAYFDAHCVPPIYKGQIAWTYTVPVHCRRRSQNHFDVVTDDRDYHLASFDAGADVWIRRIDATLNMQATRRIVRSERGRRPSRGRSTFREDDGDGDEDDEDEEDDGGPILELTEDTRTPSAPRPPLRGDQVSNSTLLLDEQPSVAGWLWKMGKQPAFSGFKKRYGVLRGIQLFYYREPPDQSGRVARSPVGVMRCCAIRTTSLRGGDGRYAFDIDAVGGRTFHCFVESSKERDAWLLAVNKALDARVVPPPALTERVA